MTGGDREVYRRLDALEKEQAVTRKWRVGIDAMVNKGKGFWLAVILVGSAVAAALTTMGEVLKHWRGAAGS